MVASRRRAAERAARALLNALLRAAGPLAALAANAFVASWRVFGQITEQRLLPGALPFSYGLWNRWFVIFCAAAALHLPLQVRR